MARVAFLNERMLLGFGVDLEVHQIASGLTARGHDVVVHAIRVDDSVPRPYRLEPLPFTQSRLLPLQDRAARLWASYLDDSSYDLIFVSSSPFFSLLPKLRTPTVVIDNGVTPPPRSLRGRLNFAYMTASQQRLFFPSADRVVCISEFVRSLLPERVAAEARVTLLGCDHLPRASAEAASEMRSRLGVAEHQKMLLYVGRLRPEGQPYKGTRDLMDAASRWRESSPDLRLVMAGPSVEADPGSIESSGAICVTDVPPSDLPALYAAADIYISASRWEGFNLPLMEAAYQGTPGVVLDAGAHPEVTTPQTAVLAPDVGTLIPSAEALSQDPQRLSAMGRAAHAHAASLTWDRCVEAHAALVDEIGQARSAPASSKTGGEGDSTDVTAVVLNYGASYEVLRKCIASIHGQSYPTQVLLVDNEAPRNVDALDRVEREFPSTRVLRLGRNFGFAGGMNRGISATTTPYVLLLNNDLVLDPGAVAEMRRVIDAAEDVVGVAPKSLFESRPEVIDSVGNLIDRWGAAYNMGIGQFDIGQYDRVEETFGACFSTALLRTEAFREGLVGPLDERYFMYYEDVDWCFRAGLLGHRFLTAPDAIVFHAHSLTTKDQAYAFKYRLIMRNLLRTVIRNFPTLTALRVSFIRCRSLALNLFRGPYRKACALVLWDTLIGLPIYLKARRRVQGRRRRSHEEIFDYSLGEKPYFDAVDYEPELKVEMLETVYRRLFVLTGEERYLRISETAGALAGGRFQRDADLIAGRLEDLIRSEPTVVKEYVARISAQGRRIAPLEGEGID